MSGRKMYKIVSIPGDGIGPEVVKGALEVLNAVSKKHGFEVSVEEHLFGGASYDVHGSMLTDETLEACKNCDAVLLGAVGGPKWENLPHAEKPEAALLKIRKELGLFANLRPALLYPELAGASTLRAEVVAGLDLMILRELTGDIYFGQPRGRRQTSAGEREAFDTMLYSESEIRRIGHVGFRTARKRARKLCSVDKANVLDTSMLWREVMTEVAKDYPDVELSHMYVDNAAMQLVRSPRQFDVIVTGNMFGDILSDQASMLTGSIGMLPSASLDQNNKGLYEPIHGSAPDLAGKYVANPLATILSVAMMMRYTFNQEQAAARIENAVKSVLARGIRTADIYEAGCTKVGTREMGDAVIAALTHR